jgi:large subunit ribosomal protein L10
MSKVIKQMEMDALKRTFQDVRDMVVLSTDKLSCQLDHGLRSSLRKKNIHVQMVKNSLTRRVFEELGMKVGSYWTSNTIICWGSNSLADLSKELEALVKKNDKILKVKGAVSEGQEVPFDVALKMPTRAEAIGRVVSLILSPASRLVGQILAPGGNLAGQIKSLGEKKGEAAAAATDAAATPAATSA